MSAPYKEGSGTKPWKVRVREGGSDRIHSFPTRAMALEFEQNRQIDQARAEAGLAPVMPDVTFRELVDIFKANQPGRRSSKWRDEMLAYTLDRWGAVPVRQIQPPAFGRWLHSELKGKSGKALMPKTKQHILDVARQVLSYGVEWGYLAKSPARTSAVAGPSGTHDPTRVQPFETWAEVLAVADATLTDTDHALIRFACATGLRPEEWSGLDWDDVDFDNHLIHVRRFWVGGKLEEAGKTPGAERDVALSKPARAALDDLPRPLHGGPIFTTQSGTRIHLSNWRKRVWKPAIETAAKKLRRDPATFYRPLYEMRHTYATLALAQGCTLEWIGSQLGHTDIRTTRKHYARFVKKTHDRMRALLDTIGEEEDAGHVQAAT